MTRPTIAAFDVDGTLTTRDCVVPFLRRFAWRGSVPLGALRNARAGVTAVAGRDRDRLRAAATRAVLAGVTRDEIERAAAVFAAGVIRDRLRSDTVDRLEWHAAQGHRIVLVSASYEAYLVHLGAHLGADVLGTRLGFDAAGRCSGELDGANCRGPEKVRRLHEWLGSHELARHDVTVWAYGDSAGDRELLADADHPVWVTGPLGSVASAQ